MVKTPRVVITPGEPAGIGPDLVVALAQNSWPAQLVVCADPSLLTERAVQLGLPLTLLPFSSDKPAAPQAAGTLTLLPVTLKAPVVPGTLDAANGSYVVETLARAVMVALAANSTRWSQARCTKGLSTTQAFRLPAIPSSLKRAVIAKKS